MRIQPPHTHSSFIFRVAQMPYDSSKLSNPKIDIHEQITNQIIDLLDQVDMNDYEPPFANLAALGIPENPITKNQYQGVNILALWFNQKTKSLTSNKWASFKQWQQIGASVKKVKKIHASFSTKPSSKIKRTSKTVRTFAYRCFVNTPFSMPRRSRVLKIKSKIINPKKTMWIGTP